MPSKRERVRYVGQAATFLHGHGVIRPGEFTEAIGVEEARRRADFEVVAVPRREPAVEADEIQE